MSFFITCHFKNQTKPSTANPNSCCGERERLKVLLVREKKQIQG